MTRVEWAPNARRKLLRALIVVVVRLRPNRRLAAHLPERLARGEPRRFRPRSSIPRPSQIARPNPPARIAISVTSPTGRVRRRIRRSSAPAAARPAAHSSICLAVICMVRVHAPRSRGAGADSCSRLRRGRPRGGFASAHRVTTPIASASVPGYLSTCSAAHPPERVAPRRPVDARLAAFEFSGQFIQANAARCS